MKPAIAYAEWLIARRRRVRAGAVDQLLLLRVGAGAVDHGHAYNVPPLRTKEWPYLDVLSESINNPIRLLLGWFALVTGHVPPMSLVISYWMVGAFFMAMKRYAEYRHIGDPRVAAAYRRSFEYYTEERLLVSLLFYATACALFAGIFIVRYHLELILFAPLAAGVFAYYLHLGLLPNSPVQNPEKLYRQRGFFVYMVVSVAGVRAADVHVDSAAVRPVQRRSRPDGAALDARRPVVHGAPVRVVHHSGSRRCGAPRALPAHDCRRNAEGRRRRNRGGRQRIDRSVR